MRVTRQRYYPFGEMITGSGLVHGFTGKEFDSEMGLNYFCQRYYDPQTGRFTQLDPQNSPTSSPYGYCAGNPLRNIDPTGCYWYPGNMPLVEHTAEEDLWYQQVCNRWFEGPPIFMIRELDEHGNLTGIDYHDMGSANNPYLEEGLIPPAEYYNVLFNPPVGQVAGGQTGTPFSAGDITMLMRQLYSIALWGGGIGRTSLLGYAGENVFWQNLPNAKGMYYGNKNGISLDPVDATLTTIIHEGLHAADPISYGDIPGFIDLGGKYQNYRDQPAEVGASHARIYMGPDAYRSTFRRWPWLY